jgi:hypothetical protein
MKVNNCDKYMFDYEFIVVQPLENGEFKLIAPYENGFKAEQEALKIKDAVVLHNVRIQRKKR